MNNPSKTLVEAENVLVRIMTLAPLEVAPRHAHSEMIEHIVCLSGKLAVSMHRADNEICLAPGQSITIQAGMLHQIKNMTEGASEYLLVQSGGKYDFRESSGAEPSNHHRQTT